MARPIKQGLDYFPLNVTLSGSVEYIRCMYGKIGEAVIISLWQRIYAKSYFIKYDKMSPLVFSADFGNQLEWCFPKKEKASWEIFDEIVKKAVEFGVFDKKLFEKYEILTSATIQKNYIEAKRKEAQELIDERYLLIDAPKSGVIATKTPVIATKTPVIAETIPQSKVKESKVKESKVKGARARVCASALLTPEDKNALSKEFGESTANAYAMHFEKYCRENGKSYKSPLETVRSWILKDKANEKPRGKNSKFCNYKDTNKIDFAAYDEQIIKEMLEE